MSTNVSPAPVQVPSSSPVPDASEALALSRRRFLRTAAVTGTGLVAVGLAACAPSSSGSTWSQGPSLAPAAAASPPGAPASAAPSMAHGSAAPSSAPSAGPTMDHDANAKAVVERFLGGEGASMARPGNLPLEPRLEGGVKVFELTIDQIEHRIDAEKDPLDALGFNGTWPGPRLDGHRGRPGPGDLHEQPARDRPASTSTASSCPNAMDGVPHITQEPIQPGASFTYEFVARTPGSHMYHSHHNATDQVGRGLLGAFIVEPKDPAAALRPAVRRDPGHRLDQQRLARRLHDQRPRLPGDRADRRRRSARRSSSGS